MRLSAVVRGCLSGPVAPTLRDVTVTAPGRFARPPSLTDMQHLSPADAQDLLAQSPETLFIDCRSEMEYLFVGHPKGAHNVPWNDGPDWEVNPHFVQMVKKLAGQASARPVLLICRSGNRSSAAARALEGAGFSNVQFVLHGFEGDLDAQRHRNTVNGWRHDGLPWEQY
ncbi:Rhodanese-like domain protein [compost metagenome]